MLKAPIKMSMSSLVASPLRMVSIAAWFLMRRSVPTDTELNGFNPANTQFTASIRTPFGLYLLLFFIFLPLLRGLTYG
jgi:hypothetical protein